MLEIIATRHCQRSLTRAQYAVTKEILRQTGGLCCRENEIWKQAQYGIWHDLCITLYWASNIRGSKIIISWCCTSQLNMFWAIVRLPLPRCGSACFLTTNRKSLRIDCSERCGITHFCISTRCMCNSYHNGEVLQPVGRGPCVCLLTGPHAWNSWACLVYSFQGIKQKC